MAKYKYARTPPNISTMPPGVPYIIGNEAAERFSFYGMRSILIIFMTHYLVTSSGGADHMGDAEARQYFALFVSAVYFLPILGAILAEGFIGKYQTIFWLSIVYCFGHFALALNDTRLGLAHRPRAHRVRFRRHQTVRFGQCWRPVWRIEQAPSFQGFRLVLFFD